VSASPNLPSRAPEWIRERKLRLADLHAVKSVMRSNGLHTVCEEARCPNRGECFARGTATFLLLGDVCTRACGFCDIRTGRDDLPDGGAEHFASTIRALRTLDPAPGIEVLTPDFQGRFDSLRVVVDAKPDVFNHNVETVPRLYHEVRRGAVLERSLGLLSAAKILDPGLTTKSGFMLGLGEREEEVQSLLERLAGASVDIVTIGQYLRPSKENLPVVEYVAPAVFDRYRELGESFGFRHVFAGPFVRSSYRAEEALAAASGGA